MSNLIYLFVNFSGRELFLSDASLFVDDAEAYEAYHREEEPQGTEQKVILILSIFVTIDNTVSQKLVFLVSSWSTLLFYLPLCPPRDGTRVG